METTTTMDATGQAGLPAAGAAAPVVTALKGVGWFSLGVVALAVEGTGWLIQEATQKGKGIAPTIAKPFKKAESTVEEALGEVGSRLKGVGRAVGKGTEATDERISAAVERAGAPVMAAMSELKAKVDELSTKVENLQSRRPEPRRGSTPGES